MARRSKDNAIDWDAVERQYRLGKKSNTQLSNEFGVSVSSIGRRADKAGWIVDKSKEVDAVTNSLLIQNASGNANPNATPTALEIKAAAQVAADVVLEHRKDIVRSRNLFRTLMEELEVASNKEGQALIETLAELASAVRDDETEEQAEKRRDGIWRQVRKLLDAPARVDSAKKLTEMLEKVIRLEREAFGIDGKEKADSDFENLLKNVIAEVGK